MSLEVNFALTSTFSMTSSAQSVMTNVNNLRYQGSDISICWLTTTEPLRVHAAKFSTKLNTASFQTTFLCILLTCKYRLFSKQSCVLSFRWFESGLVQHGSAEIQTIYGQADCTQINPLIDLGTTCMLEFYMRLLPATIDYSCQK